MILPIHISVPIGEFEEMTCNNNKNFQILKMIYSQRVSVDSTVIKIVEMNRRIILMPFKVNSRGMER